jgi:predicted XRE-type DNA-binding protein
MSEDPEFFSYTRDEFLDEFVHPDDRPALEEAHQKRVLAVRAEYLTEIRKRAGLTQAEVAEAMGVSQQRVA